MSRRRAVTTEASEPLVEPGYSYASLTDKISAIVLKRKTPLVLVVVAALAFALMLVLLIAVVYLMAEGTGIWGIHQPVAWGFAIVCFVWWIGIGHAGTLISAVLLLLRQRWRTSINRFAEAMTLFAVACAGLFPLLHLGRPWLFYWLLPYPNTLGLWPQFRSPLVWDVFAVMTYALVSLLFWYVGLIPDLATLRDRSKRRLSRVCYGLMALGWTGSVRHWRRYNTAVLLLAGLATPLVVSVHSIVSLDFAVSMVPGWHNTLFPPYFVAGAVFSGFAMVIVLAIPLRALFDLKDFITLRHFESMAKILLATACIVAYSYAMEVFSAWFNGHAAEQIIILDRLDGPYALHFWVLMACNVLAPQLLWSRTLRRNLAVLFVVALAVNVGMWLERFVIVVTSLSKDYVPAAWDTYAGTVWDWATFVGSIGLFLALLFLFIRLLPIISIFELREMLSEESGERA